MNKRRILRLIAGLYFCVAVSGFTIYQITSELNNVIVYLREIVYLEDLKAGLQIMSWILFVMTVVLAILT